ncbi:MAG: rRNA pseudouridine synthase [Planctomycetota bacterium]|nr:MAG: rRNA pseudouridine synthase [Planctomycetota bacterium]
MSQDDDLNTQRVAKLMAQRGMCSRREAERLIEVGAVLVDGQAVRSQGVKCAIDADIRLTGHGERRIAAHTTVLLHKPVGIVSTQAEEGQINAWTLLTAERAWGRNDAEAMERVLAKPWTMAVCGRLDQDSRGLLVLTQNGVLAKRLTGGHGVLKHYRVTVDRQVRAEDLARLRGPWELDDRKLKAMEVNQAGTNELRMSLVEGMKHQIRRVCAACELQVVDLLREGVGPWRLGKLPEGHWTVVEGEAVQRFLDTPPPKERGGRRR